MSRLPTCCAAMLVAGISLTAGSTLADVGDLNWTVFTDSGGTAQASQTTASVVGGNQGTPGKTEQRAIVPVNGWFSIECAYSSFDTGAWDYCYFRVNGQTVFTRTNAQQGAFTTEFAVKAGDEVAFGVHTVDGCCGAGTLGISSLAYRSTVRMNAFSWQPDSAWPPAIYTHPVSSPAFEIASAGPPTRVWSTRHPLTMLRVRAIHAQVSGSGAGVIFQWNPSAFYLYYFSHWYTPIHPGVWPVTPVEVPASTPHFGFGCGGSAWSLILTNVVAEVEPARLGDIQWSHSSTNIAAGGGPGGGSVVVDVPQDRIEVLGGNNDQPSETIVFDGATSYERSSVRVVAEVVYTSSDTGMWDYAFSRIYKELPLSGLTAYPRKVIASNSDQGLKQIAFDVPRNGKFEIGVYSADGAFGAGYLEIHRLRIYTVEPRCYADFDFDGTVTPTDLSLFSQAVLSGPHIYEIDCNGDGQVTTADLACFNALYAQGCP